MITSGLKETFVNRHIFKRTDMEEIRPEEQSAKPVEGNTVERAIKT